MAGHWHRLGRWPNAKWPAKGELNAPEPLCNLERKLTEAVTTWIATGAPSGEKRNTLV